MFWLELWAMIQIIGGIIGFCFFVFILVLIAKEG